MSHCLTSITPNCFCNSYLFRCLYKPNCSNILRYSNDTTVSIRNSFFSYSNPSRLFQVYKNRLTYHLQCAREIFPTQKMVWIFHFKFFQFCDIFSCTGRRDSDQRPKALSDSLSKVKSVYMDEALSKISKSPKNMKNF